MNRLTLVLLFTFAASTTLVGAYSGAVPPKPKAPTSASTVRAKAKRQDPVMNAVFSDAVANRLMADVRDGLESHLRRLMLSAFDADKMDGYLEFEDQIDSYFEKYDGFRVHYRVVQSTFAASRGVALVDFDLTQVSREGTSAPNRRNRQLRFEMERGRTGWKIVDMSPKEFFQ
jgi:hypothetical protein